MLQSYIGKGVVYLGLADDTDAKRDIGNASELVLSIEQETKEQMNYQTAGGGIADSISRITSVGASVTMLELQPENLALALRGTTSSTNTASITDEAHTAYQGGFVMFDKTPDTSSSITVTGSGGTPTYTEGTDYEVGNGGIKILTGSITDGLAIEVDYTSLTHDTIEALVDSANEYTLIFDGLNEADSGKPVTIELHKVKFTPASEMILIGDDYANLSLEADVLADDTITTAGLSQYFKILTAQ